MRVYCGTPAGRAVTNGFRCLPRLNTRERTMKHLPTNAETFSEIPLQVRAALPLPSLTVRDLLELDAGRVLRTDRAAGDSVDIEVADQYICQGEMIVIENSLGLRLSDFREK
jgi:flagellar motor switch protein FliN/FliY